MISCSVYGYDSVWKSSNFRNVPMFICRWRHNAQAFSHLCYGKTNGKNYKENTRNLSQHAHFNISMHMPKLSKYVHNLVDVSRQAKCLAKPNFVELSSVQVRMYSNVKSALHVPTIYTAKLTMKPNNHRKQMKTLYSNCRCNVSSYYNFVVGNH